MSADATGTPHLVVSAPFVAVEKIRNKNLDRADRRELFNEQRKG